MKVVDWKCSVIIIDVLCYHRQFSSLPLIQGFGFWGSIPTAGIGRWIHLIPNDMVHMQNFFLWNQLPRKCVQEFIWYQYDITNSVFKYLGPARNALVEVLEISFIMINVYIQADQTPAYASFYKKIIKIYLLLTKMSVFTKTFKNNKNLLK